MPEYRRFSAIMFTDIVGYTALMGSDEDHAFDMLRKNHDIHEKYIKQFNGTLIKEIGDGTLASFSLSSDAVRCAVNIQMECNERGIPLKIGIHEGETVFAGSDVFGDNVNIASRLQSESQKGCITISESVFKNIKNKTDLRARFIKEKAFKNVDAPIKVYEVIWGDEKEKSHKRKKLSHLRKNHVYILIGIMTVVLVTFVLIFLLKNPVSGIAGEKSIAVLPFENQSEDHEYDYFGDALTDEIIMQLQKIKDFKVRSNTSVMKYKGSHLSTPEIAEELKVNYVIEGAAQRFQNNVRIRVQLINAETDEHVWGETFEKSWGDIFKLQADIAMEIAGELKTLLTSEEINQIEMKPTDNLTAYEYYLKARGFHSGFSFRYTNSEIGNAIYFYEKALQLDPEFALAYVGLGCAKFNQTYQDEYYKENYGDSLLWYVNKALSINPDLPDALLWKGWYYYIKSENDSAMIQYRKILEKQPNHSIAYWWMGNSLLEKGNFLEAIIHLGKAEKLLTGDPQYEYFLNSYFGAYINVMDFENAEKIARKSMEFNMLHGLIDLEGVYFSLGEYTREKEMIDKICSIDSGLHCLGDLSYIYAVQKKYDLALEYIEKFEKLRNLPESYGFGELIRLAYILIKLDRKDEAEIILHKEIDHYLERIKLGRAFNASAEFYLAACYALLGEKDKAIDILQRLEKNIFPGSLVSQMQVDPLFESLREEQKFKAIIRHQEKIYSDIRAEIARLGTGVFQP